MRWSSMLGNLSLEKYSLGPIGHRKGGFPCGPAWHGVVRPQDMGQFFYPYSLRVIQPLFQPIHYGFVDGFSLPITLRVSRCGVSIGNSQLATISSESFIIKLETVVRD